DLPKRPGAVERLLRERATRVEQRAVVARRRYRDDAHVRVEIERRIVGDLGRRDPKRCADHSFGESGNGTQGALPGRADAIVRGTTVEDRQIAEVGPERRVLLDRP